MISSSVKPAFVAAATDINHTAPGTTRASVRYGGDPGVCSAQGPALGSPTSDQLAAGLSFRTIRTEFMARRVRPPLVGCRQGLTAPASR